MPAIAKRPEGTASVNLGQVLDRVLRSYLDKAGEALRGLPGGHRGFQVLSVVSGGAQCNQAMIAGHLGMDRTAMTYLVDGLEKAGLVERHLDPTDRRARRIALTTKGSETLAAASTRVREVDRVVLHKLSDGDAKLFRQLLLRLASSGDADQTCGPSVDDL